MSTTWSDVLDSSRSVAFFSSILGDYAFEKVGFIEAKQSFNMEYPTLITGLGANVHEIAHHWFGNSVLIKHWGDLWISEGFTSYLDGLYEEIYKNIPQSRWMTTPNGQFNFPENTDPLKIFDDKPYKTGAASIHSLRVKVRKICNITINSENDKKMIFGILKSIYQKFKGKNLGTIELINFLNLSLQKSILETTSCNVSTTDINKLINEWKIIWFK